MTKLLVLGRFPLSKKHQPMLNLPDDVDVHYSGVESWCEAEYDKKEARQSWQAERFGYSTKVDGILALGNEALHMTTGHSGIMKYRGQVLESHGIPLVASVSPSAVERTPSQLALLHADVSALLRTLDGTEVPNNRPPAINLAATPEALGILRAELSKAKAVAFDLETSGYDENEDGAFIVSISLTLDDGSCWAVPLGHPNSSREMHWVADVLQPLAERMRKIPVRIGHNAKFDCRWLQQFDAPVPCNFDTMLAAHLLDENRTKKLKDLASMLLHAPAWDIHIDARKNAPPWYLQHSLQEILEYNALDTWHTMRLYKLFAEQIRSDLKLHNVFRYIMMPASQSFVHIERAATTISPERLETATREADDRISELEERLLSFVPEECPHKVNWNPSNFLRWLLFDFQGLPVLKMSAKTGKPSIDDEVMTTLAEQGHEIAILLQERVKWYKLRSTYLRPYRELMTADNRLRTTFKLHGTVTGRMASGKADDDKVTGSAASTIRGVNLQNVPRNPVVRGIFTAPEGWWRVDADYSQLELRIAADLAQERRMMALFNDDGDIHTEMAMRLTGKPRDRVTKQDRTSAKATNFGFLFGMYEDTFIAQAKRDYGLTVTMTEATAFRTAFFDMWPDLVTWHRRQKLLARKFKRVQTPLGRIRHLPDIDSPVKSIANEAARQAINAPVQGFGSDICLLSINILHRKFRKAQMRSRIVGNVHDAICAEIPDEELSVALPMIKTTMENPPLKQLFGYEMSVPLKVDVSVGKYWGEDQEEWNG